MPQNADGGRACGRSAGEDMAEHSGTVRTSYELHTFHVDHWLVAKTSVDLREIEAAAQVLIGRDEVEGIRIARCLYHVDFGYVAVTIVAKRLRPGVAETDPLQIANPGRDASWCDKPEDLGGDQQRLVMRTHFLKYLEEKRLTPLEILHYEVHAKALDQAGTTVQGALQRIASQQVRGTKQTAVARMKQLLTLVEEGLSRLVAKAKDGPPVAVAPGAFAGLVESLAAGSADPAPALYRGIARHLADAKTWLEKIDRLFQLHEPGLPILGVRVIDSLAAEMLSFPQALKDLSGEGKSRLDLVKSLIEVHAGHLASQTAGAPPGVATLSRLLAEGALPRTQGELRHGILRHLVARLPLLGNGGLVEEMEASFAIQSHLATRAPVMAADEEIVDILAMRLDRLIQPDPMGELLAAAKSNTAKVEVLLSLLARVPSVATKAKIVPYLRSYLVPDDLIRDAAASGNRADAIAPLAQTARRVAEAGLPEAAREELAGMLDAALFELIRADLMGNQTMPFVDRILLLVRACAPLPDGRARQIARDTLALAVKRPEFFLNYLERFPAAADKRAAFQRLRRDLIASRLVDPALVPAAD